MANEVPVSTDSEKTSVSDSIEHDSKRGEMQASDGSQPIPAAKDVVEVTAPVAAGSSDEDMDYPHGLKLVIILAALCLAIFLVALDNTIISTAIPKITDHFHSIKDIGWYGSSYLLTATAMQPTFGRIYSIFSVKYTFLTAIAIFELG